MPLQLAPDQHVELLIGAADFEIGFERDRIVTLDQRIEQLVQKQRLLFGEPLLEVVALQHPRDAHLRGNLDQAAHAEFVHPFAVEADLGELAIENLERLRAIGFGVALDLLARQRLARLGASGRIADHRGKIADQENHGVARALKVAQLLERQAVTEMQIGRGRIHPELDAQRPSERDLRRELGRRNNFGRPAGERRRLFIGLIVVHFPLGQFRSPEAPMALKRTGILTARNSPPLPPSGASHELSAACRLAHLKLRALARRSNASAPFAHRLRLANGNQSQQAQPAFHHAERMFVDHPELRAH